MTALAKVAPHVNQHMITTSVGVNALKGHPLLKSLHAFKKRHGMLAPFLDIKSAIKSLNLKSPVILQPHQSPRSSLLAKFLGYPVITYKESPLSFLAHKTISRLSVFHETDRIGLLLQGLNVDREYFLNMKPSLPVREPPAAANFLLDKKYKWIAVAPGSVWATKRWPVSRFAALVTALLKDPHRGIVLLGGPDDFDVCNTIEGITKSTASEALTRLVNLAGKTDLQDLLGIYPYLEAVISNDSSPIHYASAFNIPTLGIFGATVPSMGFAPLADHSRVAQVDYECRPCGVHGHKRCPLGHFKCMTELSVDLALEIGATPLVRNSTARPKAESILDFHR